MSSRTLAKRVTMRWMLDAGWRLSLSTNLSDFIVAKCGPGKYSYVGHNGACYIEGTAKSWADLERQWAERHASAVLNGVIKNHEPCN
jgi:hypothetical protein